MKKIVQVEAVLLKIASGMNVLHVVLREKIQNVIHLVVVVNK